MTRLLAVEVLRLRSRRVFWVLAAAAVLGIALNLFSLARDAHPPSAAALAAAEQRAAQEAEQFDVPAQIDACLASQAEADGSSGYPPDFNCEDIRPTAANFLGVREVHLVEDVRDAGLGEAGIVALVALLIGVSFLGADWSAGVVGTQLVYEPRRTRVYAAKLLAVAGGAVVVAVVVLAVHVVGIAVIAAAWGSTDGFGASLGGLALLWLRIVAVGALAGAMGVAMVAAIRSSIAVLGIVMGYLLLGEGLLHALWKGVEPWLLSGRFAAWVQGSFEIQNYDRCDNFVGVGVGGGGDVCEPEIISLTLGGSGAYFAVGTAVAVALTLAVFHRRDVS